MITLFNSAGDFFIETVTRGLLVNTIFMTLIFAVLYFTKFLSAATRYRLGMIGLVKLYIPPICVKWLVMK
ncbi:hypothetical protein JW935_15445 [candidate division KSB1 bacterium]|nr:hypothetical protein [candidate division KSB1 bacterium]